MTLHAYRQPSQLLVCICWFVVFVNGELLSAQSENEKRRIEIAEGPAVETLKEAARQANIEFIFPAQAVDGIVTSAINGDFTPMEAFRMLLQDTSLVVFQHEKTGVYVIDREDDASSSTKMSSNQNATDKYTEMTPKNKKDRHKLKKLLAAMLTVSPALSAQDNIDSEERVYELSPFSVDGSHDSGYRATSTLAGTRIKTNLRDVGSSISVVTKEFLEDTGATDAEDLLVYMGNVEVGGLGGNFSGASIGDGVSTEGAHRRKNSPTRIRGLNDADMARNYFLTDIPFDAYNTDRIMVNRGPNAVLFGLGSPAGIINNGLIKAAYQDMNNIEMRYDQFGSNRFSFDLNRLVVEDQLAVRVAGLYNDQKFRQDHAFERDRRIFATFSYTPFAKFTDSSRTTITGHAEVGEIDANRPRISPPGDTITPWWSHANQESVPHTLDWRDTDRNLFSIPGSWYYQIGLVYPDETSGSLGPLEGFVPITPAHYVEGDFLPGYRGLATFQDYAAGRAGSEGMIEGGRFYRDVMLLDRSVFDARNHLLDGPNKSETASLESYNVALQQELLDGNAGIEVSFDKQRWGEGFYSVLNGIDAYSLQVDVNPHYPDGSENPNFGRPFVSGNARANDTSTEREALRFTGFGQFDFRDRGEGMLSSILGRHTFTGMYNSQEIARSSASFGGAGPDQRFLNLYGVADIMGGNFGDVRIQHYLGDSLANANSPSGANVSGIQAVHPYPTSVESRHWDPEAQEWVTETVALTTYARSPLALATGGSKTRDEIDSLAFIWQGYLFNDNLVLTAGWREDEAENYRAPTPARDPIDNHVLLDDTNFVVGGDPVGSTKQSTWTYSAVLHAPQSINDKLPFDSNLSFHYNQSENFEPVPARFNIIGEPIGSPQGKTEDLGATVSMFGGKFVARINFFETQQTNVGASGVPTTVFISRDSELVEANSAGINDGNPEVDNFRLPPQEILDFWGWEEFVHPNGAIEVSTSPRGSIAAVTSRQTEGMEIELTYNPTETWRIHFNASRQEAVQSGLDSGVQQLLAERQPVWDATGSLLDRAANFTMDQVRTASVFDPWNRVRLSDGAAVQELREWRWNLITNYDFRQDSFLEGFGVGGALRWQDEVAIGAPVVFSEIVNDYVLDINNPIMGDSQLDGDMWVSYGRPVFNDSVEWGIRLNVRNVIGEDDFIPIAAQPDGTYSGVRIPNGTVWQLTTTFDF